jgi:transcriptional regulator with XRE-family HTH domain
MIHFKDQRLVSFGVRVRTLREGKGWTISDVVSRGNIGKSDLVAIESGNRSFSFTTLLELCKSLEVTPSELLNFDFEI